MPFHYEAAMIVKAAVMRRVKMLISFVILAPPPPITYT